MTITTTMAAPAPAHLVVLHRDDRGGYQPVCSCGWHGTWNDYLIAADTGVEHRDGAIGPPDAMDRLMSGLLDLQDDLAAVVIWLAENWTAHLPSLGWYSNGADSDLSRPAVTVTAYCTPAELVDAAAVLGVTPVDDPDDDTEATPYRRAVRRFGRVELLAYAKADRAREPTP